MNEKNISQYLFMFTIGIKPVKRHSKPQENDCNSLRMKNILNKINTPSSVFLGFLLLFSMVGCKKFVEIPPAPSLITSSQVFSDSTDAASAVLGLYISMINYSTTLTASNGLVTVYTGLAADELYPTQGIADENSIYANSILPTNASASLLWSGSYSIIYMANACITGIQSSTGISSSAKNQLIGESEVVRAFLYFNLVNLYGPVPLITSINYQLNALKPRASIDSIYSQIESDLLDAQARLPIAYPSNGSVRPNQYTANALLARVYLYRQQWADAESASTKVINSGLYSLPSLGNDSVFMAGSSEAIWQIIPAQQGYETAEGYYFVPQYNSVIPNYVIDSFLLKAFEPNDLRRINWLDSNVVNGQSYYYPYKYKYGNDGLSTPVENYMILRLGEQYLIRAEARAEQEKGDAIDDLNIIRQRANLPVYAGATDKVSLLNAIYHERQVELFCEWGHRWFDIKRTGIANTIMPLICNTKGGAWNADWELFPVYIYEMQTNPNLTQNPGY